MFLKIFKQKSGAQAQPWTRKLILDKFASELNSYSARRAGNKIVVGRNSEIEFDFISNNYAKKDEIDLNATIKVISKKGVYEWVDLFHLIKSLSPEAGRPLNIKKSTAWNDSNFHLQMVKIVRPLVGILLDADLRAIFLRGDSVQCEGADLKLSKSSDNRWILEDAERLNLWLQESDKYGVKL